MQDARAPTTDWWFFACSLRALMRLRGAEPVDVWRAAGVARTTLWRARHGRPLMTANFERLCAWLGWEPATFARRADGSRPYFESRFRAPEPADKEAA